MSLSKYVRWLLPAFLLTLVPAIAPAQVAISVTVAPPELPVYEQPPCPEDGWMWSPGYWAWGDDGYYWVPGAWVPAPYEGALWTPPWWGWDDGRYIFHQGYWGDEVGYYGGIDYGYGYMGIGFVGGEWRDGAFDYNTAVMRVNPEVIHHTYVNENIVRENTIADERRVAFNGGPNGIHHEPMPVERRAMSVRHTPPTPVQQQHLQTARSDRQLYAKVNGGHPHTLAVARPAEMPRNAAPMDRNGTREPARPGTAPTYRGETRGNTPETRPAPNRPETRPAPAERPRNESRPAPEPRPESRPAPETRPAPRPESRPASESRPAPQRETRPAPEPRPAPQPEFRPAPPPRAESRPAPEPHPAPQRESRPAPPPRAESRPAPEREAHPAPPPKEEKPRQ